MTVELGYRSVATAAGDAPALLLAIGPLDSDQPLIFRRIDRCPLPCTIDVPNIEQLSGAMKMVVRRDNDGVAGTIEQGDGIGTATWRAGSEPAPQLIVIERATP